MKKGTYTPNFKQHVVEYMHKEHLSISENNVKLTKDDTIVVAQLIGGRLRKGSTILPENFSFQFVVVIFD